MMTNKTFFKKIIFIFSLYLLTMSFKSAASEEFSKVAEVTDSTLPFIVSKGSRFDICNDVASYINKHRSFYDSEPRELFSIKDGKFGKPKSKAETVERYIQIALQQIAYGPIHLTCYRNGWKSHIAFMEKRIQRDKGVGVN